MASDADRACYVCGLSDQNELEYGEFLTKGQLSVHYFCLLFSTDLEQLCKTDQGGLRRFRVADIRQLHMASKVQKCLHCSTGYATIRCAQPTCAKVFHFICGLRASALPQFTASFAMFCHAHLPPELHQPDHYALLASQSCAVCLDRLPAAYSVTSTIQSCCRRGWFHTNCVRRFALAAGYYTGCLLCRQTRSFADRIRSLGVYVPEREAAWERPDNENVRALRMRHSRCDIEPECLNAPGRESRAPSGRWALWLCHVCAAFGAHAECARQASMAMVPAAVRTAERFICPPCMETCARKSGRTTTAEGVENADEAEQRPSLADQTLCGDADELNCAQFLFGSDCGEDLAANDEEEVDDGDVIEISSGSASLRPSDSYSLFNYKRQKNGLPPDRSEEPEAGAGAVAESPSMSQWLAQLETDTTELARRKFRLRLLLGREFPLDRRMRL